MTINVDTGKIDKECELNRNYACCGCVHYYDESDTVCKRGCINYVKKLGHKKKNSKDIMN
ncbi:hypothetical protein J6O48_07250 [bacterium]|nr:hypothetical protein [bacterium]